MDEGERHCLQPSQWKRPWPSSDLECAGERCVQSFRHQRSLGFWENFTEEVTLGVGGKEQGSRREGTELGYRVSCHHNNRLANTGTSTRQMDRLFLSRPEEGVRAARCPCLLHLAASASGPLATALFS